jgi:hypothetical protein
MSIPPEALTFDEVHECLDSHSILREQPVSQSDCSLVPAIANSGFDAAYEKYGLPDRIESIENPVWVSPMLDTKLPHPWDF